jgi:hypothetical protein
MDATLNTGTGRRSVGMKLVHLAEGFAAGLLVVALLTATPVSLTPSAHAEMDHDQGTAWRGCLTGCAKSGPGVQTVISNQRGYEKQDKGPVVKDKPYYALFFQFQVPRELKPQYAYGAPILRPPDLVILYANYRI